LGTIVPYNQAAAANLGGSIDHGLGGSWSIADINGWVAPLEHEIAEDGGYFMFVTKSQETWLTDSDNIPRAFPGFNNNLKISFNPLKIAMVFQGIITSRNQPR
jgi:hypothetical protein